MKGKLTVSRRDIILFRHGALQMISVEEENGEKRNLEEDRKRLRFNYDNGESEE